jgi:hypothetical protein
MNPTDDKPKRREIVRDILEFIFGFRNTRGEVLDMFWLHSASEFNLDPQEFYGRIEKHLEDQKIPGMEISRVEFAEGGLLSNQRQYLRLMRERFAIDTCAAPFGKNYFFSCRFVHVPALVRLWHIVAAVAFFGIVGTLLIRPLGIIFAAIAVVGLIFAIVGVLRNAEAFTDLDAVLLKIPVIATVYENWFRVETYYRMDTRSLYASMLPKLIEAAAEEVCATKGVKIVRQSGSAPRLGQL